jgi:hypothetical protein
MCQEFQGWPFMESKPVPPILKHDGNKNMTRTCKKNRGKYEDNVRKTFILNFNKMASIYKEEEKLEASAQGGGMNVDSMMGGGTYYKT